MIARAIARLAVLTILLTPVVNAAQPPQGRARIGVLREITELPYPPAVASPAGVLHSAHGLTSTI